jgi:hypothetical protein
MLRKMVFGPRGRLSTDLDFTLCSEIGRDDLVLNLLEAFGTADSLFKSTRATTGMLPPKVVERIRYVRARVIRQACGSGYRSAWFPARLAVLL